MYIIYINKYMCVYYMHLYMHSVEERDHARLGTHHAPGRHDAAPTSQGATYSYTCMYIWIPRPCSGVNPAIKEGYDVV